MSVSKCSNGLYRIGNGSCIYVSEEQAKFFENLIVNPPDIFDKLDSLHLYDENVDFALINWAKPKSIIGVKPPVFVTEENNK